MSNDNFLSGELRIRGKALTARFRGIFGTSPRIFQALGRVNVIGEHTDYNDGFVMPAALEFYTWFVAAKPEDRVLEAYSAHFDERITLSIATLVELHSFLDCFAFSCCGSNCDAEPDYNRSHKPSRPMVAGSLPDA